MLAAASNTFPLAEMEGIIPRAENVFRVTCYLCLEVAILIPETERVLVCRSTTNKRRMVWNWIEHNNLRFIACIFISNMQNLSLPNKIRRLYSRNMGAPASWWRQNRCQSYKDLDSFWVGMVDALLVTTNKIVSSLGRWHWSWSQVLRLSCNYSLWINN